MVLQFTDIVFGKEITEYCYCRSDVCNVWRVCHFHADSALLTSVMNTITEIVNSIFVCLPLLVSGS
jgi:hypothetical protein